MDRQGYEKIAALRAELDDAKERLREYEGCPHCGCDHPVGNMCAPHECRPGLTMTDRIVAGNIKYRRERDAARQQVAERDRIIEEQRQALCNLERTIDAIDVLTIPPDVAAEHTRQVGGPVSGYLTAYTEPTVIQHVKDAIAERDRQIRALREAGERLDLAAENGIPYVRHYGLQRTYQEILDSCAGWRAALLAAPAPDDENRRLREALEAIVKEADEPLGCVIDGNEMGNIARAALAPAPARDTKGEGEGDHAQH